MEKVICAAIKIGRQVFYGHRHNHAIRAMNDKLSYTLNRQQIDKLKKIQGFVTTEGRFVDRKEGMKIQIAAGIKSANKKQGGYFGGELYSEDYTKSLTIRFKSAII